MRARLPLLQLGSILIVLLGCSDTFTKPQPRIVPGKPAMAIECTPDYCPETNVPDYTAQYYAEVNTPSPVVSDTTDFTAQDALSATWSTQFDTSDNSDWGGPNCDGYDLGYGRINYSCPDGPCYNQWRAMKDGGMNFTGTTNGMLIGGFATRGAWGLWTIVLPASTRLMAAWSALDKAHRDFLACISVDENWRFYNNDVPNPYKQTPISAPGQPR